MSTENTIEDLKNRTPGGFGVTVETLKPTEQDIRVLSAQLGRKVRDVVEIPARCVCGNPLVAATAPRLSNGTPDRVLPGAPGHHRRRIPPGGWRPHVRDDRLAG